jgi:hypothetical protein
VNVNICGIDHYNLNTALRLQITTMANSQVAVQAFKLNTGDSIPALGLGQFDWLSLSRSTPERGLILAPRYVASGTWQGATCGEVCPHAWLQTYRRRLLLW